MIVCLSLLFILTNAFADTLSVVVMCNNGQIVPNLSVAVVDSDGEIVPNVGPTDSQGVFVIEDSQNYSAPFYTSQRMLNTVPANINGVAYVPGPEFVNSAIEKWGTYYPNSSGIPFTIFYKEGTTPSPDVTTVLPISAKPLAKALHAADTALVEPFVDWRGFGYYHPFFTNPFCWTLSRTNPFCFEFCECCKSLFNI